MWCIEAQCKQEDTIDEDKEHQNECKEFIKPCLIKLTCRRVHVEAFYRFEQNQCYQDSDHLELDVKAQSEHLVTIHDKWF